MVYWACMYCDTSHKLYVICLADHKDLCINPTKLPADVQCDVRPVASCASTQNLCSPPQTLHRKPLAARLVKQAQCSLLVFICLGITVQHTPTQFTKPNKRFIFTKHTKASS